MRSGLLVSFRGEHGASVDARTINCSGAKGLQKRDGKRGNKKNYLRICTKNYTDIHPTVKG